MQDEYAHLVLVDIGTHFEEDTVRMLFQGGLIESVEAIGTDKYQIAMGVQAVNVGEAYRKAVNVVESLHRANDAGGESCVMGASVYPPSMDDGDDPVVFS